MNWINTNKRLLALVALVIGMLSFFVIAKSPDEFNPLKYPHQHEGVVGPCREYWLGTILGGHDLANYVGQAMVRSISVALVVSLTTLSIAVLIGGLWALSRNEPRRSLLSIVVLTGLGPTPLLMMIAVLYCFEQPESWAALVLAMCSVAWAPMALRMRNEVLRTLSEPFVQDARRQGIGDLRLLWEEILPQLRSVIESLFILAGIGAVTGEATVSYLAGKKMTHPSLGVLLGQSAEVFQNVSPEDGMRLLLVAAVMMTCIVVSLRLWGAWREDVRLSRAMSSHCSKRTRNTIGQDGFFVSVSLRRLGIALVRDVFIPYLPGEILAVSGGSGSGKTTAGCAIAEQLDPDLSGNCRAVGAAIGKKVMMQPQGLQEAFADGTPLDRYFAAVGLSYRDAMALVDRVGVSGQDSSGDWKTGKQLSGGEAQRIAAGLLIESTMHQPASTRPHVLIFDESVSALDDENADRIGNMLRNLLGRFPEMAVIVVNHRPEWTRKWADRVSFLGNGRELWSGTPQILFGNEEPKDACEEVNEYRRAVRSLQTRGKSIPHRKEEAILVEDLSAGYFKAVIVQDVSLKVHCGEALVITGKSGCGKTTLLRAIAGGDSSLNVMGDVRVFGDEVTSASPGSIRYAVQNPVDNLNPAVTVGKILSRFVRRQGLAVGRKAEQKLIVEACQKSSFPIEALGKTPAELNGGARIRAGLARTFIGSPRILLLDEPTAGLDPETAVVVLDQLRQFLWEGGAVIAVMHDMEHVGYLGARRLRLE